MAGTTVANLVVEVSASAKKLTTDLASAENTIGAFATRSAKLLAGVGVAVAAAAVAGGALVSKMVMDTARELDDLGDFASSLGIATKELERLQFQAGQVGSSAEGVGQSLMFMQNAIQEATEGNEKLSKAFGDLGLDAKSLKGLKPEEQFRKIADSMKRITDQSEAVSIARGIFGRGGLQQLNLLRSNLDETSKQFDKLGLGVSEHHLENADAFDSASKKISAVWKDFKNKVAGEAIPAFTAIGEAVVKTIEDMGGLGPVATNVAVAIVGAVEGIAGAFILVADGVRFIHKSLLLAQIAASEIKGFWDTSGSEARNAPTQAEIDRLNARVTTPRNMALSDDNPLKFQLFNGKSKEQFTQEAADAKKQLEDLKTSLIVLSQPPESTGFMDTLESIRLKLEGVSDTAKKTSQNLNGVAAGGGGFGTITDEATGRTITIGSPGTATGTTSQASGTGSIWNDSGKVATINLNITPNQNFFDVQADLAKDAVGKTLNITSTIDPAANRRR